MQILKSKKLLLLLIRIVAIFTLAVTTSLAQEKTKISGKRYGVSSSSGTVKVDDTEGHIISVGESKGFDVATGAQFYNESFNDLVKGTGTHRGYGKAVYPDGDVSRYTFEGKINTTHLSMGKPVTTFEGTFSITGGTGKYENAKGGGTYIGQFIGEGIFTYDWEGELVLKKSE